MRPGRPVSLPTASAPLRACAGVCAAVLAAVALIGCGEPIGGGSFGNAVGVGTLWGEQPGQPHPLVERDLDRIRTDGTLRMIAHYNSHSYFVHKGGQAGFDYELVHRFARERGLTLEVVVAAPGSDVVTMLNTGQGDLVCTGGSPEPAWGRWVRWTRPTNFLRKLAVTGPQATPIATLADLTGRQVMLPDGDPFRPELKDQLRRAGVRPRLVGAPPQAGPEDLLGLVRNGRADVVVVDDLMALAALVHAPGLQLGVPLGERRPAAWLVRENSSDLLAALNEFLKGHFQVTATGRPRQSRDYGIIHERYFSNRITINEFRTADFRPDKSGRISSFDAEVRRQSVAAGLDWRLVSALMFQESRFDPTAVSQADARGLMQVLPRVAGAQADSLHEPSANLRAGLRLMRDAWHRYAYLDSLDRTRFTLAEYHAGFGHINDARRLAMDLGRDPNAWSTGLATTLPLLMEPRWYGKTRHGFYGGRRTVTYVQEILGRYRAYMRLVPREPSAVPLPVPAVLANMPETRPDPP